MNQEVGTVGGLHRYGVKSALTYPLSTLTVGYPGVIGDRQIVVVDSEKGFVITAKLKGGRGLLNCIAWQERTGSPNRPLYEPHLRIVTPGSEGDPFSWREAGATEVLCDLLGRHVELVAVGESQQPLKTNFGFSLRAGVGYDSSAVHLLTTASLTAASFLYPHPGAFDPARYRPNIVVSTPPGVTGFVEDEWVGRILRFPCGLRLGIRKLTERCPLPTQPQPWHGLEQDGRLLGVLKRGVDKPTLGVYAYVIEPGMGQVEIGDEVILESS